MHITCKTLTFPRATARHRSRKCTKLMKKPMSRPRRITRTASQTGCLKEKRREDPKERLME